MKTNYHEAGGEVLVNGFWIGVVDPKLLCSAEGVGSNCFEDPTAGSDYPDDSYYYEQASRKIFVSLNNINLRSNQNSIAFCGASLHDSLCFNKPSCNALGWSSDSDRNAAIGAQFGTAAVTGLSTATERTDAGVAVALGLRTRSDESSGGTTFRAYEQTFSITVPEDIFVLAGDADERFSLKSGLGQRVLLTWGLMASTTLQSSCASGVTHEGFVGSTPYLKQLLRQTAARTDAYDMTVQLTQPPTGSPSPEPTASPTDAPTTKGPTPSPTPPTGSPTPRPTGSPIELQCPKQKNWELCSRLNTGFKWLAASPNFRRRKIRQDCLNKGCHFCNYDSNFVENCRPKMPETGPGVINRDDACPASETDPFRSQCSFLPNCPPPQAMSACRQVNEIYTRKNIFRRSQRKHRCERSFKYLGRRYGARTCLYANGQCGAVGEYYWARSTISRIPFFFTGPARNCPFE